MHDFDSAAWAEHHGKVSDALEALVRDLLAAFDRLQRRRFDAPWTRAKAR